MSLNYIATIRMKQDDTGPALGIKVTKESDNTPLDLTGATATFSMRQEGETTSKVDNASATVTGTTTGLVEYAWDAADTDTAGTFRGEFTITLNGGEIITVPNDGWIEIEILENV